MIAAETWSRCATLIARATKILILNPFDADGDSLGATLALAGYARQQGKTVLVACAKAPSERMSFLPGFAEIDTDATRLRLEDYDLAITADFADPRQLGLSTEQLAVLHNMELINIDHHRTNTSFGTLNIVDPNAAAASEMVTEFFEQIGFAYDKDIATCLLAGIIYDTGGFIHLNTTEHVVSTASQLLLRGARLRLITAHFSAKSVATLQLWGLALSRLQYHPQYGLSTTILTQADLALFHASPEAAEGIANFLNGLGSTKAILFLREEKAGLIKGSLRSTVPGIDISGLAKALGGGGHAKAAGFALAGTFIQRGETWQIV